LVEVADEYHLHRETLFLAVNFVDRFLSVMAVQRSKLQLVGTAAMFIAAYVCCAFFNNNNNNNSNKKTNNTLVVVENHSAVASEMLVEQVS